VPLPPPFVCVYFPCYLVQEICARAPTRCVSLSCSPRVLSPLLRLRALSHLDALGVLIMSMASLALSRSLALSLARFLSRDLSRSGARSSSPGALGVYADTKSSWTSIGLSRSHNLSRSRSLSSHLNALSVFVQPVHEHGAPEDALAARRRTFDMVRYATSHRHHRLCLCERMVGVRAVVVCQGVSVSCRCRSCCCISLSQGWESGAGGTCVCGTIKPLGGCVHTPGGLCTTAITSSS
jgi:hypothetical protein